MRWPALNDQLKASRPFGCLFATLLGTAMAFVIVVGSLLGDCAPGAGCHDSDGVRIVGGLLLASPIVLGGSIGAWLAASLLRRLFRSRVHPNAINAILAALTGMAVWFSFRPAFHLFFWLQGRPF